MDKVVGRVWNPTTEQFQAVIGYKLNSKGFFQFFAIGTKEHLRKQPAFTIDQITPIPDNIYLDLISRL